MLVLVLVNLAVVRLFVVVVRKYAEMWGLGKQFLAGGLAIIG